MSKNKATSHSFVNIVHSFHNSKPNSNKRNDEMQLKVFYLNIIRFFLFPDYKSKTSLIIYNAVLKAG